MSDHLGSSAILTDNLGTIAQMTDYNPYGKINYENIVQNFNNNHKFTGQEYDDESDLQYYGARYLDNEIGKFISVDPASLSLGNSQEFLDKYDRPLEFHLANPQNLNSYSYVTNNPLKYVDPDGEIGILAAIGFAVSSLFWGIPVAHAPTVDNYDQMTVNANETRDFVGSVVPAYNNLNAGEQFLVVGLTGGLAEKSASKVASKFAANKSTIDRIVASGEAGYSNAVSGSGYDKFLKRYIGEAKSSLEKSLRSFQKVVDEHVDKLSNPAKYLNVDSLNERQIQGYINKWKTDLFRNSSYKNIIENILKNK